MRTRRQTASGVGLGVAAVLCLTALTAPVSAQDAGAFFRSNCYSCHTIGGGRVTGPDLKDVSSRRQRPWLVTFLQDPKSVIDSGDPYALQLMKEARNVIMPKVPGLDRNMAEALIDLIDRESSLEESNFMGLQVSDAPLSEEQITLGRGYFTGSVRMASRGPACLSCHSAARTGLMGGGQIGPDLTKAFERLGGRRRLATWIIAPEKPTMKAVFANRPLEQDEISHLAAFLEFSAKNDREKSPSVDATNHLLLGGLGSSLALLLISFVWRDRKRDYGSSSGRRPR